MKRAVKWIFIIVGGLLILTIAALLLIPSFVDVQRHRAEIENRVSEIVGVPVSIDGDLRLSVIPWLGVAVSDIQIGNPEGFQEKQMLSIKSVERATGQREGGTQEDTGKKYFGPETSAP